MNYSQIEESIGYLLRRVNRIAREVTVPVLEKHGLLPMELSTLVIIRDNPGCTLRELAGAVYLEPPATHRMIKGLEEKGLVTRNKSDHDARYIHINITPAGQDKIDKTSEQVLSIEHEFTSRLTDDQKENLISMLKTLAFPHS